MALTPQEMQIVYRRYDQVSSMMKEAVNSIEELGRDYLAARPEMQAAGNSITFPTVMLGYQAQIATWSDEIREGADEFWTTPVE
jgi:hypothetical protein